MDNDLIRYGGFRGGKMCMYKLSDGLKDELSGLQEIKKLDAGYSPDDFKVDVQGIWQEPIIPDSFINKIAKDMVRSNENRLIQRIYELPENYIINNGATILFWKDGTKTVVKRSKDEKFDKRLGFLTAYFQKHCGMSKTKANKFLDNLEVKL